MPLPPSAPRDALHTRKIALNGYRRADGLFDVEAHMTDTKREALNVEDGRTIAAGDRIHDMWVRLVVDEDLIVVDVVATTDASPFDVCSQAAPSLDTLKGVRIGPGWSAVIRERLSGARGCTHLTELLKPLATVAFQTLFEVRRRKPAALDRMGKPTKIDSCHAYAATGDLVRSRWPKYSADD